MVVVDLMMIMVIVVIAVMVMGFWWLMETANVENGTCGRMANGVDELTVEIKTILDIFLQKKYI